MKRRSAFTLVEILWAMTILALVTGIVLPKLMGMVRRAKAASVVADLVVVRHAVFDFNAETQTFPPQAAPGAVPDGLATYLPATFTWTKPDYTLAYENWLLPSGLSEYPSTKILIGVSVITPDQELGQMVMKLLGSMPQFTIGNRYTFVIIGL